MSARPFAPCHLKVGQLIDANLGFVDTFNWMADTLFQLAAKNGVKIEWQGDDHPVIMADEEAAGTKLLAGSSIVLEDVTDPETGDPATKISAYYV